MVLSEFKIRKSDNLEEVFNINKFMIAQNALMLKEMFDFSISKIEKLINKTIVKLNISLDELKVKSDSLLSIIKEHKASKLKNTVKIAQENFNNQKFYQKLFTKNCSKK